MDVPAKGVGSKIGFGMNDDNLGRFASIRGRYCGFSVKWGKTVTGFCGRDVWFYFIVHIVSMRISSTSFVILTRPI